MMPIPIPGGVPAKRELHFFWIADHSHSMEGHRLASLNQAIKDVIPAVKQAITAHPEVQLLMRSIKFSTNASWHGSEVGIPVENFHWADLHPDGGTSTAQAINLLADALEIENMPQRGLPPVCVLISDGYCTDPTSDYQQAIRRLLSLPWGKRTVRLAIGIGQPGVDYDEASLKEFISHEEIGVLPATSPEKLTHYLKWASVSATMAASNPASNLGDVAGDNPHTTLNPPPPLEDDPFGAATSDDGGVF